MFQSCPALKQTCLPVGWTGRPRSMRFIPREEKFYDLFEELADKIVDAASRSIATSLSAKDQEKLLDGFLNKVVLQ